MRALSMEARMSLCNMAIEGGARAGLVAPDEITFTYIKGRPMAPTGAQWDAAVKHWKELPSDEGAHYDKIVEIKAEDIAPTVTWGTSPQDAASITSVVPNPADFDSARASSMQRSLDYMGLVPGTALDGLSIDKVFIGSCTNARIEDVRAAASIAKGKKVASHVQAMVVPGSGIVKAQAEAEGLDKVLIDAGFDWREPGCSMCLAMNPDKLEPQERCASTSNRNFEGRQGNGGRTHLVSPAMAATAAITGGLTDVRKIEMTKLDSKQTIFSDILDAMDNLPNAVQKSVNVMGKVKRHAGGGGLSKQFTRVEGKVAKLDIQNIDTDMIIPKQFLKTIKRSGLGVSAFYDMRYEIKDGKEVERSEFILNKDGYRDTKILVAGDNFGCGSSREHAPWAIGDFGIKCIISTSFADIFYNNCFKNGMLPILLPRDQVEKLMKDADAGYTLDVNLQEETITRNDGSKYFFSVDPFRKNCLLKGLDDIGLTMEKKEKIDIFEKSRSSNYPWLDNSAQLTIV